MATVIYPLKTEPQWHLWPMRIIPALVLLWCWNCSQALAGIEDGPRHADHPEWMAPGLVDLKSDLEDAKARGKTGVMLLYTTEGCTYCAEFIRSSLGDPAIRQRVQDNFTAIGLEIFDDAEMTDHLGQDMSIKEFAETHKAGMAPTLLFFGTDKRLIFRAVGYQSPERFNLILDYLTGNHYQQLSFGDYLRDIRSSIDTPVDPAPMRDDPLFIRPPYALSRVPIAASAPLLVIFETPGCTPCKDFHRDVLALDEVRQLLQRFEVVRLDARDASTPVVGPDGRPTTPAEWYERENFTRVPALLYVNETGEAVFKTDAVIERQRMLNACGLVLDRAYEKGWSYQRYARTKAIERNRQRGP